MSASRFLEKKLDPVVRRGDTRERMTHEKTILITGGGKRIGAALATHAASLGWNLVLHYHRGGDEVHALGDTLKKNYSVNVSLKQADLRDATSLADFWRGLPPVTALVHNAAMFERDTLTSMTSSTLQAQLQVNFTAPLVLTQGFMKQLPHGANGSVTILGDGVMGWSVSPEFFTYALSKHAWIGALDVLAAACAPRARVNLIALAPTLPNENDTPEMFARLAERAPLKRTGEVAEVCSALAYLLNAPAVTGQILNLANGAHLQSHRATL